MGVTGWVLSSVGVYVTGFLVTARAAYVEDARTPPLKGEMPTENWALFVGGLWPVFWVVGLFAGTFWVLGKGSKWVFRHTIFAPTRSQKIDRAKKLHEEREARLAADPALQQIVEEEGWKTYGIGG